MSVDLTGLVDLARLGDAAACVDRPDLPWVADAHLVQAGERAAMGAVCAGCPVLASCQEVAVQVEATAGYWAGTHRDARVLEPAQQIEPTEPAEPARQVGPAEPLTLAQELVLMGAVVWVHHDVRGWEQAAIDWPPAQDTTSDTSDTSSNAAGDAA